MSVLDPKQDVGALETNEEAVVSVKVKGHLEIGVNYADEIFIKQRDPKSAENVAGFVLSVAQARNLAALLNKLAADAALSIANKREAASPIPEADR